MIDGKKILFHGDHSQKHGFDLIGVGEQVYYHPWESGCELPAVPISDIQAMAMLAELADNPETAWRIRPGNVEDTLGSEFADQLAAQARRWDTDNEEHV